MAEAATAAGVEAKHNMMHLAEPTEVEERYYENNRHFPIIGWSIKLLPTDRWLYSDETGRYNTPPESFKLPWDWIWKDLLSPSSLSPSASVAPSGNTTNNAAILAAEGKNKQGWRVEVRAGVTDKDGWMYARDFPAAWQDHLTRTHNVRRRCFVRTRVLKPDIPSPTSASAATTTMNGTSSALAPSLTAPAPSTSSSSPMSSLSCYENQRYYPIKGWSSKLLPSDRRSYSDSTGRHERTREMIDIWMDTPLTLPSLFADGGHSMPGTPADLATDDQQHVAMASPDGTTGRWVWHGDWRVVVAMAHTDSDGWQYAVDFPAADYQRVMTKSSFVRRREWKRNRVWHSLPSSPHAARATAVSAAIAASPPPDL